MIGTNLFVSATEARNDFFTLLSKVKKGPYPIHITVKGVPEAVVVKKEDFDSWMATLETLSDLELMKSVAASDKDLKEGRYSSLEDVAGELGFLGNVSSKSSKLG